jgi:hypothetical protein
MAKRRVESQSVNLIINHKVENWPKLRLCKKLDAYHWKDLDKDYNFSLNLTSIKGLHKLWASKMARIPISGISRFLTWESQEK